MPLVAAEKHVDINYPIRVICTLTTGMIHSRRFVKFVFIPYAIVHSKSPVVVCSMHFVCLTTNLMLTICVSI